MQAELSAIITQVKSISASINARAEFEAFKATIQGPKGRLTAVMKMMSQIPKDDKPAMGQLINQAKNAVQMEFDKTLARIEQAELSAKLGPNIDPTLPSPDSKVGTRHPIAQVRDEVVQLFQRIGFSVAEHRTRNRTLLL